jgi:hypothetical protein
MAKGDRRDRSSSFAEEEAGGEADMDMDDMNDYGGKEGNASIMRAEEQSSRFGLRGKKLMSSSLPHQRMAAPGKNYRQYGDIDNGPTYEQGLVRGGSSRSLEFLSDTSTR